LQISPVSKGATFAGRYKILKELGRGGMGVVYKAQDLKLKRPVAIKFLATELTQDKEAKERFVQEAQAASALDHPNICTIHEIDEAKGGRMYITMGFCEGESLRERLERKRLEIEEAVGIARQAAEGLARAHAKGIVHRDIKPANIMLAVEGRVKIVDFGLAKLAGQVKLTRVGTTVGTVSYMSPEQARGEETDHRSDIWSLGVVLYEMLAGELPFGGEQTQGVIYSILNKAPKPLSVLRPDISRHVEDAVTKALEKNPAGRYQKIEDMIADLTPLPHSTVQRAEKSIVVLPFEDMSPGKDNEYFSDGLTEEIITDLSHVHDLLVISRSSAMTFKGTKKTIPEIARSVDVRYVLEGSVRKAGNNLRITAQLIDAHQDAHVWAEKYSGTLDDVFDIQEKVSRAIVDALRVRLSPSEHQRLARRYISDFDVYDDWLRARHLVRNYSTTGLAEAIVHLENGLKRIGDNPQVMAGLAYIHVHLGFLGSGMEEDFDKAVYWATKALALDDGLAQAHQALGIVEGLHGRPRECLVHLKAALATEPGEWETHQWLAYFYMGVGRHAEGLIHAQAMVAVDPVEPLSNFWLMWALLYDGKTREAVSILDPSKFDLANPHRRLSLAWTWAWLGKRDDALGVLRSIEAPNTYEYNAQLCLLLRDALRRDREAFHEHLTPDLVRTIQADAWGACTIAEFYCLLGDVESALPWLDRAAHWGWFNYPLYARTDPFFEPLRGDPRFKAFLERVKSQWEHFEV
jgi:non-specific serine/threonine protein kinase